MEQTTALESTLKSYASVVAQRIRSCKVSEACWIDGIELARLRAATGLDLLGDRITGGRRADGAYLQNLYSQCNSEEYRLLRSAVNQAHLPSSEHLCRLVREADLEHAWGLDDTHISLVAFAVMEVW